MKVQAFFRRLGVFLFLPMCTVVRYLFEKNFREIYKIHSLVQPRETNTEASLWVGVK
ncbi:hypothetical protein LEP1GSC060_1408 [Leptospira weilii serovar Ranarum str. ICFT]|uniref:Uncharacterized protein n=1 Tax=Leptospira weilii serovar Ranarum str. ICFT TaxID=1218598 RepID=N1WLY2_9LEPT|nr:hypothetical protein LEP1GSC060_1408 [Leptospira weilii serovar Ranarum str. ICFT]